MKEFITGLRYPLEGFKLIFKPGIRLYVIIPLLVNAALFSVVIIYGAHQIINLSEWLSSTWNWAEWIVWLIWPLFVLISITVVFYCFTLVANLIAAPFNSFLADAAEHYLAGQLPARTASMTSLPGEIIVSIKNEFYKFTYFAVRALPLLILFLIPMFNTIAPLVWFLFCSWLIALEYLDFPMSNNDMAFSDIRNIINTRRSLCIGFGMGVMLMTAIPFVNFLAMPVAVTSATRLWNNELKAAVKSI